MIKLNKNFCFIGFTSLLSNICKLYNENYILETVTTSLRVTYIFYKNKVFIKGGESMLNVYPKLKYMKILGEKIDCKRGFSIGRKSLKDFNEKIMNIDNQLYDDESYGIIIEKEKVEIYCDSDRAFNYGVLTLQQLKKEDKLYCSIIFDYPHMKIRGIIEGFYGEPWTFKQRWEAIATISKYKMNTYIYAPKNDLYHRIKWSQLYKR